MKNGFLTFPKIFDASLQELIQYPLADGLTESASHYIQILIAYLNGDVPTLRSLVQGMSAWEESDWRSISAVARVRLQIRTREISSSDLEKLKQLAAERSQWQGEFFFVAAMAHETQDEPDQ